MLLLFVSLTISRITYAVEAAQLPLKVPSSCVTLISPELSKANTLLALSAAELVNSVEVIVLVLDNFIDLPSSSSISEVINVNLSNASSRDSALKLSFSTRSRL